MQVTVPILFKDGEELPMSTEREIINRVHSKASVHKGE